MCLHVSKLKSEGDSLSIMHVINFSRFSSQRFHRASQDAGLQTFKESNTIFDNQIDSRLYKLTQGWGGGGEGGGEDVETRSLKF